MDDNRFNKLESFLKKVPAVIFISNGFFDSGLWWIKFGIDINNQYAWQVVQEVGHVVNYVSLNERLPTVFYPVSPPPYMNGGPRDFLSWVIESTEADFTPDLLAKWLEGRMPRPVDDLKEWPKESEE